VTVPGDLGAADTTAAILTAASSLGEGLLLLVHAAGRFAAGPVLAPGRDLEELLRVNVVAPVDLTRALQPMLVRRGGTVVLVGSTAATRPARPGTGAYDASKHALRAVGDALRPELAREGVRVVSVHPGRTAGAMQEQVVAAEGRAYDPAEHLRPEDVADVLLSAVATGGSAAVTELVVLPSAR
jgi:NAD(P)-dependent dehydrogenase (short-subunit alcohol dehydrogenase family)